MCVCVRARAHMCMFLSVFGNTESRGLEERQRCPGDWLTHVEPLGEVGWFCSLNENLRSTHYGSDLCWMLGCRGGEGRTEGNQYNRAGITR